MEATVTFRLKTEAENTFRRLDYPSRMPSNFRTVPCKYFLMGQCFHGNDCSFSHNIGHNQNFMSSMNGTYNTYDVNNGGYYNNHAQCKNGAQYNSSAQCKSSAQYGNFGGQYGNQMYFNEAASFNNFSQPMFSFNQQQGQHASYTQTSNHHTRYQGLKIPMNTRTYPRQLYCPSQQARQRPPINNVRPSATGHSPPTGPRAMRGTKNMGYYQEIGPGPATHTNSQNPSQWQPDYNYVETDQVICDSTEAKILVCSFPICLTFIY